MEVLRVEGALASLPEAPQALKGGDPSEPHLWLSEKGSY